MLNSYVKEFLIFNVTNTNKYPFYDLQVICIFKNLNTSLKVPSVSQVNAPQNEWSRPLKLDLHFAAVVHECFLNGVLLSIPVPRGL